MEETSSICTRPTVMRMRYVMTALGCLATFIALKPQFFLFPWKLTIWEFKVLLPLDLLYYLAFLAVPVPFATWAQRTSVTRLILATMIVNIISTCLSEFAFLYNAFNKVTAFNLVFVVELTKDVLYPTMGFMISKWSTPSERSFMSSVVYSGGVMGSILVRIGLNRSGGTRLCITVLLGIAWCIVWCVLATDSPRDNCRISEDGKNHIQNSLDNDEDYSAKELRFPFRQIFTSLAFISLAIVHICVSFVCGALMLMEYRIVQEPLNGSLPIAKFFPLHHVLTVVFTVFLGGLMSLLVKKKLITTGMSRKIATLISLIVPLLCLLLTACVKDMFVVCILVMIGFVASGAKYSGTVVHIIDVAPNFSGILLAIFTTIETLLMIFHLCMAERISYLMLRGKNTEILVILMVLAGMMSLAMAFYWQHGSDKEQRWSRRKRMASVSDRKKTSADANSEEETFDF